MIEDVKVEQINSDGSKVKITNADKGIQRFLVPFNAVVDIDFAILRMIQAEYNNPNIVDQSVMRASTKKVKELLLNREDTNPVTICIHNKQVADNIYKEIMLTRYDDLIDKYHTETGIFFMLSVMQNLPNVTVDILCQSDKEVEIIKKYNDAVNTVRVDKPSDVDVNKYTIFIVHNAKDVYLFEKPLVEKYIIILNYRFNVHIDKKPYPNLEVGNWIYEHMSTCCIADTYSKTQDPDYATLKVELPKEVFNNDN